MFKQSRYLGDAIASNFATRFGDLLRYLQPLPNMKSATSSSPGTLAQTIRQR